MLLTITGAQPPATDLGHLPHKNPACLQSFDLSFGRAHVVHECVFGVPALESEPVDPRL
jgi:RNA repair, ligase-Pnkp-associating, region of Hen1/PNKP adenylyltransferase domain, C-terminal region